VIELDGGQHYDVEMKEKDRQRDIYLKGMGLIVLRFSDREIFENWCGIRKNMELFMTNKIPPSPLY